MKLAYIIQFGTVGCIPENTQIAFSRKEASEFLSDYVDMPEAINNKNDVLNYGGVYRQQVITVVDVTRLELSHEEHQKLRHNYENGE